MSVTPQDLFWQEGFGITNPSLVNGTGELRNKKGRPPQYRCRFGRHGVGSWQGFVKMANESRAHCAGNNDCDVRSETDVVASETDPHRVQVASSCRSTSALLCLPCLTFGVLTQQPAG